MKDLSCNPKGCERVAGRSERSEDHRYRSDSDAHPESARDPRESLEPLQGARSYFHTVRWSSLRFDHRLLSRSPSGLHVRDFV